MSFTHIMRWPCVLLLLLWHDLEKFCTFVLSPLALELTTCALSPYAHSRSLSRLPPTLLFYSQIKPFVFLEKHMYLYTHTQTYTCICIFLRVNLHSYFSHCCIFFKIGFAFFVVLVVVVVFNTCSLFCCCGFCYYRAADVVVVSYIFDWVFTHIQRYILYSLLN